MQVEKKLEEMGIKLNYMGPVVGSHVWVKRSGNLLFLSGHPPAVWDDESKKMIVKYNGKIGADLSLEDGKAAARLACINCLTTIKNSIGDLDKVKQIVRMDGWVNCVESVETLRITDAASDLLTEVFGEKGQHVRMSIGVKTPLNVAVGIQLILEVED